MLALEWLKNAHGIMEKLEAELAAFLGE